MPKLIAFNASGYVNTAKEFRSNDPDLALNGDDFVLASAIVLSSYWTLFPEPGYQGTPISLSSDGGPDTDGSYKDYADWNGTQNFHVKSIQFN